tara:strand:- start:32234 stop:32455 length:222 start_codon:yes stop_codon:yes gene_type:complete
LEKIGNGDILIIKLINTKIMIMTKNEIEEFDKASKPLIEYLAKNHHPHMTVIVKNDSAEIMEGKRRFLTTDFI